MSDERAELHPADETIGDTATSPEDPTGSESTDEGPRRGIGRIVLAVFGAAALLTLVLALGSWSALRTKTTVPDVTGLPVPIAAQRISAAQLTTATMATVASPDYDTGVVIRQLPIGREKVSPGTRVDLLVAVVPTMTVVPDVSLNTTSVAQSTIGAALLRPVMHQQLSDSVAFGRVVAQMPRAGERTMTGQQVVLFVSAGPGTGGAVVPSVVGETVGQAATHIADVYLLAFLYELRPGMSENDKVTDQIPAPGTRVPIGSAVPLMTTGMSN